MCFKVFADTSKCLIWRLQILLDRNNRPVFPQLPKGFDIRIFILLYVAVTSILCALNTSYRTHTNKNALITLIVCTDMFMCFYFVSDFAVGMLLPLINLSVYESNVLNVTAGMSKNCR